MDSYAHSHPNFPKSPEHWEPLFTPVGPGRDQCQELDCEKCRRLEPYHGHANKVAWLTAFFVAALFAEEDRKAAGRIWGYVTALLHDLGKFAPEWQRYLAAKVDVHSDEVTGKVDHSTAGAQRADRHGVFGRLLAYAIAGHHTGLADAQSVNRSPSCLSERLQKKITLAESAEVEALLEALPPPPIRAGSATDRDHSIAIFTRMIFSALVDADFLATESFMGPERARDRPQWPSDVLTRMSAALDSRLAEFSKAKQTPVNRERARILAACFESAELPPGLFTLTVPTGGGKTLASLAFALRHALKHGLQRVIYVIPFTSIIEQNADEFRSVFRKLSAELGYEVMIEHHSNLEPKKDTTLNRLAAENWDAPLVITTNVQFFESLFANRTSRCRKLHRLANAVIIFDEAQALPVSFLQPCLSALRILQKDYRSSLVLCTATQPAIVKREEFPIGLSDPREIVPDVPGLFDALRRTKITWLGKISDQELIERMKEHSAFLTVVSTRRHAAKLFAALGEGEGNFHLSAQMCADHRSAMIAEIRQRLKDGKPVRLVSTQLIEAGVDLDFPVVFRSLAGLDSIAQAAGRCNREGLLEGMGHVFVFEPEQPIPRGGLRQAADSAIPLLHAADLISPENIRAYFESHYWSRSKEWDLHRILDELQPRKDLLGFQFATVAKKFKLINEEMKGIVVPYGEGHEALLKSLEDEFFPGKDLVRKAQRLTVQIRPNVFKDMVRKDHIRQLDQEGRFHELTDPRLYDPQLGLLTDGDSFYHDDPEELIL